MRVDVITSPGPLRTVGAFADRPGAAGYDPAGEHAERIERYGQIARVVSERTAD
jgi:hypothetical protein